MFKVVTTRLNISFFDYYEMTPKEIKLMLEGCDEEYRNNLEMTCLAMKIAIINALKGKNHKLFKQENKKIDPKDKKKELEELNKKFN